MGSDKPKTRVVPASELNPTKSLLAKDYVGTKEVKFELDGETAAKLEQMAENFGETPESIVLQAIRLEWEKAKKAGKIGEA